jgi:hypothetical protein
MLIALFALGMVHLAGAQARLSGWVTLLASTVVVGLSLLDSAFIIAAVKASSSHPATAIVSYDLIVGPTNDAVGRTFLLTLRLILPLGVVLLGPTPGSCRGSSARWRSGLAPSPWSWGWPICSASLPSGWPWCWSSPRTCGSWPPRRPSPPEAVDQLAGQPSPLNQLSDQLLSMTGPCC